MKQLKKGSGEQGIGSGVANFVGVRKQINAVLIHAAVVPRYVLMRRLPVVRRCFFAADVSFFVLDVSFFDLDGCFFVILFSFFLTNVC
jgi:hypothetical protein